MRTVAGRALLDALPLDEWHPINREIVTDHILAIEREAAVEAMREARNEECPPCDDSWASHVAGLHRQDEP